MTKDEVKALRAKLEAELKAVGEKLGVTLKIGNATFDSTVTFKLEAIPAGVNPEAENFKFWAHTVGLKPSDLGREFLWGGKIYVVSGFNLRKRGKNLLATHGGKTYCFNPFDVRRLLVDGPVAEAGKAPTVPGRVLAS